MTPSEIRAARKALGLTQHQLAILLGFASQPLTKNNLSKLECGSKTLDPVRKRLLQAYIDGYRPADWPCE